MTNEEKRTGIIERFKSDSIDFDPLMLSALIITKYLFDFQELGILEGTIKIEESGKKIIDIINEFNWLPSDSEIEEFISNLVSSADNKSLITMVKAYRNNPQEFISKIKNEE